jgi:type I restriction enzyme S subunit
MELITKQGFKQTEVGLIPEDWKILSIGDSLIFKNGLNKASEFFGYGTPIVNYMDVFNSYGIRRKDIDGKVFLSREEKKNFSAQKGDVFFTRTSETQEEIGTSAVLLEPIKDCVFSGFILRGRPKNNIVAPEYYQYCLIPQYVRTQIISTSSYTTRALTNGRYLSKVKVIIPPTLTEQKAIATALSDVDELISSLEQLITKKKAIKQGAMQQLLKPPNKGGKRLPGFSGEWEYWPIELVADCLDNLRVPLNGEQRNKMNGDIPYCGANGIVDYVDDYVVDDNIILMAEDGGYFDEYKTRHIAYRMIGKCWVNNHAHILKAKKHINQGYLFYTLVHKNILDYINGGTRAKLNKSEMNKIESWFPYSQKEQKAIAQILFDMDAEIEQLETKKAKYQSIKQGMMQELLTGKTRLV